MQAPSPTVPTGSIKPARLSMPSPADSATFLRLIGHIEKAKDRAGALCAEGRPDFKRLTEIRHVLDLYEKLAQAGVDGCKEPSAATLRSSLKDDIEETNQRFDEDELEQQGYTDMSSDDAGSVRAGRISDMDDHDEMDDSDPFFANEVQENNQPTWSSNTFRSTSPSQPLGKRSRATNSIGGPVSKRAKPFQLRSFLGPLPELHPRLTQGQVFYKAIIWVAEVLNAEFPADLDFQIVEMAMYALESFDLDFDEHGDVVPLLSTQKLAADGFSAVENMLQLEQAKGDSSVGATAEFADTQVADSGTLDDEVIVVGEKVRVETISEKVTVDLDH